MHSTLPIIIIGSGLAGYQLAKELRRLDAATPLVIITADLGKFYSKPLLSTALTQKKTAKDLATATAVQMAQQLNAVIFTETKVTAIDPKNQTVTTENQVFHYRDLVLACGADVLKPSLSGNALDKIVSINHLYHYEAFESLIKLKHHITIFGAGLIGCEFANDLTNAGYEVHIIAPSFTPLDLLIPEQIGFILKKALEENGVHFHLNKLPEKVDKLDNGLLAITLSDQSILKTEFILSAIGLKPNIALAKNAGIKVNRGILVNRALETSEQHIFALGDCAEVEGHVLPYILPIMHCAKALAKTLTCEKTLVNYPAMPVIVKTPVHPIVICPPPKNIKGNWDIEINGNNVRALFYNESKQLYGFVLTNAATKERLNLITKIPDLLL